LSLPSRTRRDGHKELAGFARLAGSWPIARIAIRTRDRPETAAAWIDADVGSTVAVALQRRADDPSSSSDTGSTAEDGPGRERASPATRAPPPRQHQLGL
jgi:hypothetical protein